MPTGFSVQLQEIVIWVLVGIAGGAVGGLAVRGGAIRPYDALFGIVGALLGGVVTEFFGLRESVETIGSVAVAFFTAMLLTAVVRLLPGRFSA